MERNTERITMAKKSDLSIQEAFDLFIRKCRIKNLTDLSIVSYEKKMVQFYNFMDRSEPIASVTKDTVDDYILWLMENTEANDITINSYLRSVRAFLSTALDLRIGDIDFQNAVIILRKTKNRKQQIIPLSATLADILQEYLLTRGGETDDFLFCNEYGGKASCSTYQQLVRRYNRKRGVEKNILREMSFVIHRLSWSCAQEQI